ncbi:MAG: ArnT family glycosyltransferase, partial [Anaerolineales bacterium]
MALAGIMLLAGVIRFWAIASLPRGLNLDEAYNGIVILDLLNGRLPAILTAPWSAREPLIFYIQAFPVRLFGPTPGAMRITTSGLSWLLVLSVYLLNRKVFGVRISLVAALIMATTLWPVYHGRFATRPILLPVFVSLAFHASLAAWHRRHWRWWLLSGVAFGAVSYTYTSSLFIVPSLIALVGMLAWFDRAGLHARKWGILIALATMALISLPMIIARINHPSAGFARSASVSVFYPGQNLRDSLKTIFIQTGLVLRMFFIKGDMEPGNNIPGRPVFDMFMAIPFIVGGWYYGVRPLLVRKINPVLLYFVIWTGIWLLPTWASKSPPQFLRANGIMLSLFIFPALGLLSIRQWLEIRSGRFLAHLLVSTMLGASTFITARDYHNYLQSPVAFDAYSGHETVPIIATNKLTRSGWVGTNLVALPAPGLERMLAADIDIGALPLPYAYYLTPWFFDPYEIHSYDINTQSN